MLDPIDISTLNNMRNEWIAAFAAGDPEPVDFMFTRDAIFEPLRPTPALFDNYDSELSFRNEGHIQNGDNWVSYRSDYTLLLTPKGGGETIEETGRFYTQFRRGEDGLLSPIRGPRVGQPAPEFVLNYMKGGEELQLSSLRGQPTVLVFGSYTGGGFRRDVGNIEEWYASKQGEANFLLVYVEEAHPSDAWGGGASGLTTEEGEGQIFQPTTYDERETLAELCTTNLDMKIPTVLDKLDNKAELAYAGFPDRLYVLDSDGVVYWKSWPGPEGYIVAEARQALDRYLESASD